MEEPEGPQWLNTILNQPPVGIGPTEARGET